MNPIHAIRLLACAVFAAGIAASAPAAATPPRYAAHYVEVSSYLHDDAAYEAWYTLRRQLRQNFDDICGDTFCEGDYSNIESLRYLCSVDARNGRIGRCGWSFAASDETIAPRTGAITSQAASWFCLSPLQPGTTIEGLLVALAGDEPLYAALPGSEVTLYDGLVDCL